MLPVQVRLTAAIPTVTHAQRMQFLNAALACMNAQGIFYTSQPGENRIRFYNGSHQGCVRVPSPPPLWPASLENRPYL